VELIENGKTVTVIPFQSKWGNWRSSSGGGRPRAVAVDLRPMRLHRMYGKGRELMVQTLTR